MSLQHTHTHTHLYDLGEQAVEHHAVQAAAQETAPGEAVGKLLDPGFSKHLVSKFDCEKDTTVLLNLKPEESLYDNYMFPSSTRLSKPSFLELSINACTQELYFFYPARALAPGVHAHHRGDDGGVTQGGGRRCELDP